MRSLALFVMVAGTIATPAAAQIVGRPVYDPTPPPNHFLEDSRGRRPGIGRDVRDLRDRIDRARAAGQISRREARQLDREARQLGHLARRYGHGGISGSEIHELERRVQILRADINRPRAPTDAPETGRQRR